MAEAKTKNAGVKLWAPDHPEGCHIGLTNGTTFMVPCAEEGVEVPTAFRREAIARGCLPVGVKPEQIAPEAFDRAVLIRTKMESMLGSDDPLYFGTDGKPNLAQLNKLCGFTIDRTERDKLWAEVEAGIE